MVWQEMCTTAPMFNFLIKIRKTSSNKSKLPICFENHCINMLPEFQFIVHHYSKISFTLWPLASSSTTVLPSLASAFQSVTGRLQPSFRILHLDILNCISQILDQNCNADKFVYNFWQSLRLRIPANSCVSSVNSLTKLNTTSGRSLM